MTHYIGKRSYSIFFKKSSPIKLGRWTIPKDPNTVDLKVDRANHDSCGGPLCTIVPLKRDVPQEPLYESEEEEMLRFNTVSSFHLHVKKN